MNFARVNLPTKRFIKRFCELCPDGAAWDPRPPAGVPRAVCGAAAPVQALTIVSLIGLRSTCRASAEDGAVLAILPTVCP
jgi:hypothetical protein